MRRSIERTDVGIDVTLASFLAHRGKASATTGPSHETINCAQAALPRGNEATVPHPLFGLLHYRQFV